MVADHSTADLLSHDVRCCCLCTADKLNGNHSCVTHSLTMQNLEATQHAENVSSPGVSGFSNISSSEYMTSPEASPKSPVVTDLQGPNRAQQMQTMLADAADKGEDFMLPFKVKHAQVVSSTRSLPPCLVKQHVMGNDMTVY